MKTLHHQPAVAHHSSLSGHRLTVSVRGPGFVLLALGLLVSGCRVGSDPQFLLLLSVDTLRADRLGSYGSERELTPNLDALLRESVVFSTAYAPCSYTLPSVSTLMTGRYPEELGLYANTSRMGSTFATLASVLQVNGWSTGAAVSNYVMREGIGFERGFEIYDATFPQREVNRDMPERIASDTTEAALAVTDRLLATSGSKLFLWAHYQDPHGPYSPPEGYRERFLEMERKAPGGDATVPVRDGHRGLGSIPTYQILEGSQEAAFYRAGYHGEIAYLDEEVGRLLAGLEARGLLKSAIVVFTADHGEALGENDYWFAHGEFLTDGLVRIPLAVRAPGLDPGQRDDPVGLVDVFPTLLALLGIHAPAGYPGRDVLSATPAAGDGELYLAGLRHTRVPRFGLVAGDYKYLVSHEDTGTEESLFRLGNEEHDLAAEEPDRLKAMGERLARFRQRMKTVPETRQRLSPAQRERLEQLGYVVE